MARILRDAGCEVVYAGLRQSPESIAAMTAQEDVDVVGVSMHNGAHLTLAPAVVGALGTRDPVVVGGIVPPADVDVLLADGVAAVLGPGASNEEVVATVPAAGWASADRRCSPLRGPAHACRAARPRASRPRCPRRSARRPARPVRVDGQDGPRGPHADHVVELPAEPDGDVEPGAMDRPVMPTWRERGAHPRSVTLRVAASSAPSMAASGLSCSYSSGVTPVPTPITT